MAKKNSLFSYLYLVGMVLVVIGFFCPMFSGKLATGGNGFKFINFDRAGTVSIGALLVFAGAVLGIIACFVTIKAPVSVKLIALAVSILGGVLLVIGFNSNVFYKAIGKNIVKHSAVGFWLIVVGWLSAVAGTLKK